MLLASDKTGSRFKATPHQKAFCPLCENDVLSKCGKINVWHWAHVSKKDCDAWSEHETIWHSNWKSLFPDEWTEITMEKKGEKHRADIVSPTGIVLELQHSYISPLEILERETFYKKIIWLFDITDPYKLQNFEITGLNCGVNHVATYQWKHIRKHITFANHFCLDTGKWILIYNIINKNRGVGRILDKIEFVRWFLSQ